MLGIPWLVVAAATDGSSLDFTPYLAGAGPFAIGLAIGAVAYRDMKIKRDQSDKNYQELVQLVLPALAEGRDTVRDNTRTMEEAVKAMKGLSDLAGRIPTEAEMTRIRDLLARRQGD
jgi:hypothetical protein